MSTHLIKRHLSITILVAALFAQVVALAYQVQRPTERGPVRLIRVWSVRLVTPVERVLVRVQDWARDTWYGYFYLRNVRRDNQQLQEENLRLRLEQVRLSQDASQAQRLQALMHFKEQFISETVPAQVIGSSGSEQSRVVYIDKGYYDGIRINMAVITPTGIAGKIIRVLDHTAQVLMINDQSSGVGVLFEKSRLQGILKGNPDGEVMVRYIMADEKVERGELILTSGGDHIFPKGMTIGYVKKVSPGSDGFLNIWVQPASNLIRLEEVLVITKVVEKEPEMVPEMPLRAADILAQRLPTIQPKLVLPEGGQAVPGAPGQTAPWGTTATGSKPVKPNQTTVPGAASKPKPNPGAVPGTASRPRPSQGLPVSGASARPKPNGGTGAAGPGQLFKTKNPTASPAKGKIQ